MPLFMLEPVELKEESGPKHREILPSGSKDQGSVSAGLQVRQRNNISHGSLNLLTIHFRF